MIVVARAQRNGGTKTPAFDRSIKVLRQAARQVRRKLVFTAKPDNEFWQKLWRKIPTP
jgi:hypothetical protein